MKPLPIASAVTLLVGKSVTLLYLAVGTEPSFRFSVMGQPLLFLLAAVWLVVHPKTARWLVGAFFAYAAIKEAMVFPTFVGSTLDLIRRPFSMGMAAWLAWALIFGRDMRFFLAGNKESSESTRGKAHRSSLSSSHLSCYREVRTNMLDVIS